MERNTIIIGESFFNYIKEINLIKIDNISSRGSQQSRNNYNNENGADSAGGSSSTFFRNNERYSGGNRYNNDGNRGGGFNKPRDGTYRAGSGRFPVGGGTTVPPMGASSGPRK